MYSDRRKEQYLFQSTPKAAYHVPKKTETPILTEWRFALVGLFVSIAVIAGKILISNFDTLKGAVLEQRLITSEVIQDSQIFYEYAWKNVVKYSNIWLPILCGFLTTYFTWMVVYLDSHVPGIQPPSPFSPQKYTKQSGHLFHLNYVFAVLMGVLVSSYMFWRRFEIQF